MPRHIPPFKHGYPNGLLTSRTEPATNQVGQSTFRVYAAMSATELHISAGQDSLLHREISFRGRLGHWKQSINMKTNRRTEFGQKSPPEVKRRPLGDAKRAGRPPSTPVPLYTSCRTRKESEHPLFQQAPPLP